MAKAIQQSVANDNFTVSKQEFSASGAIAWATIIFAFIAVMTFIITKNADKINIVINKGAAHAKRVKANVHKKIKDRKAKRAASKNAKKKN